ncbi:rhamnogalacturonan endolyase [Gracilibacillus ureilyticus]|uniref:Rhamnogalacturonan endolyase n=1 Tax=Gracilibacillus ureilyticus TaxID=531814 RepID=A0A1H9P7M4_9BACI|nr:rhamnogalacturonan lyase [Gracilibacillus ureilyticus]SER44314.1 rhamnogalacturonan endolyase [Gracilibacillus ureilyticus]
MNTLSKEGWKGTAVETSISFIGKGVDEGLRISNYFNKSFLLIVVLLLVFSNFGPVLAEDVSTEDKFEQVYFTDFGDSGELTPENWGFTTSAATLSINEEELAGNNTAKLQYTIVDQSGGRVATKTFDEPVRGTQMLVEYDWYPGEHNDKGTHPNENGGEFRILDSAGNTVFTLNHTKNAPLKYFLGNNEATTTGFSDPHTWYNLKIMFDLLNNNVTLTMENKESGEIETYESSLDGVSFDGTLSTIRLVGIRTSGNNHTWTTYLDNIKISQVPIADNVITNVPSLPYHRVYAGETTENIDTIGLPDTVPVVLASNEIINVAINEWKTTDRKWNPEQEGIYHFEGTIAEDDELENIFSRKASIYVYNRLTPPDTNRDTEWLNRGVIALKAEDGIFISWRLLADEYDKDVSFNIYRDGRKLNDEPLSITNYMDEAGEAGATYKVETLVNGKKADISDVTAASKDYLSIPLQKPEGGSTVTGEYTYSANDASVGDLDGDGEYEIILLWRPSNAMTALEDVITGPTIFDAYELDGTLMWRMNMGMNLTSGPQYHQFVVADMDGNGKSEFLIKTADATKVYGATDGVYDPEKVISVIGNEEDDGRWINDGGHVVGGPEYVSVFNGETGEVIDTIDFAFPVEKEEGDGGISWGDNFYNRSDRFLSGVAYINGKTPSAIYGRGYYGRTGFVSYSLKDGQLVEDWVFDTDEAGRGEGLGNHNLATGDVDNDGFDEIVAGSLTLDHDGTILYAMDGEMGREKGSHGDALHLGAFDPDREGLHVFGVHEDPGVASLQYRDGATGETLRSFYAFKDAGRGVAANITSNPGYEFWGAGGGTAETGGGVYNVQGDLITDSFRDIGLPVNFVTYWDGDLFHELLDGTTISKYDEETNQVNVIESFENVVSNNGTKANPTLQADILGDWREEAIYPTEDSSELRIFSTTIPTEYRLPTLMHDTVYRMGIAWQNTTYNQPPHISYYLGEDVREDVLNGTLEFPDVDYTANLNAMKHTLELTSNDKKLNVLQNKLEQAQRHLNNGRTMQASKQLDVFIKHLAKSDLEESVKDSLNEDAVKLKDMWNR